MTTIIFTLLLSLLILVPVPVSAHYSNTSPIIESTGHRIGTVTTDSHDNLLYTDYDFDNSSDCKLQSITTTQNYHSYTYTVTSVDGNTLTQYPNTYIAPRDAVLAFDTTNQNDYQSHQFSSLLEFNCPDGTDIATVNRSAPIPTTRFRYHHDYNQSTNTPTSTTAPKYSYKEWLKNYAKKYNLNPTPTPASTKPYSYSEWLKEYSAKYL